MSEEEKVSSLDLPPLLLTGFYILYFAITFAVYVLIWIFFRNWILMDFSQLWQPDASVSEALESVWFIFVWGFGIATAAGIWAIINRTERSHEPLETLLRGAWISLNAGFFEELIFRWLIFFTAMATIHLADIFTFGFVEWLYTEALIPLANWATLGALETQLVNNPEWIMAAAIISANASFRKGHTHLGIFGWVNSWFMGMVFFYLMFNYGLWSAIVAHVLYDLCVFTAAGISYSLMPRSRWSLRGF